MNKATIIALFFFIISTISANAANLLLSEGFETGFGDLVISADNPEGTTACSSVCTERQTNVVRTGSYAAVMCNGGATDGFLEYTRTLTAGSKLYIKYYQYFPTPTWVWDNVSGTGMKQIRAGAGQGDGWPIQTFKVADGIRRTHGYYSECYPTYPNGCPDPQEDQGLDESILFASEVPGWPYGNNFPPTGEWLLVEMYFYWDNANSGYWWRVNGYTIGGDDDMIYDTWPPPWGNQINNVRFAGGNGMPTSDGFYYIDDVEIWDDIPSDDPVVVSASIGTDGETVTVNFSETVVTTGYDNGDFDLDCVGAGNNIALNSIPGSGSSRSFTAASTIYNGDTCNLDYTGGAGEITDTADPANDLAPFSDAAVANNSNQSPAQEFVKAVAPGGKPIKIGGKRLTVE